jgi:hypothetical protein
MTYMKFLVHDIYNMLEGKNKKRAWCVEKNHMEVGKVEENKNPQQELDDYP